MKRAEMAEAVRVLGVILDALLATLEGRYGRSFMTARHAIGKLRAVRGLPHPAAWLRRHDEYDG